MLSAQRELYQTGQVVHAGTHGRMLLWRQSDEVDVDVLLI